MRRARGFTLIEVLLATLLLALALALALATLRAATATVQRGEAIAERSERMRAVSQFLRRRLAGARPVPFTVDPDTGVPLRFIGEPDRLRFVADLPDYLGRGGPYLHDLQLHEGADGLELRLDLQMVLAGLLVEERTPRAPEVLAAGLEAIRFRYRALDEQNRLGEWQERWEHGDRLPLQVEITLRDADGRAWPPLVVALPLSGGGNLLGGVP